MARAETVPAQRPQRRQRRQRRSERRVRRRFVRRQWARRWRVWRYVVALLLVVALAATAVWAVWFSSLLAVEGVAVEGTRQLSPERVREVADVPDGVPLARLDLAAVRLRVQSLAAVRSVDVSRQWPHQVRIAVEERQPVAGVQIAGQLHALDADGVVFGTPAQAAGLPRVVTTTDATAEALREGAAVAAALPPPLARLVDYVELRTIDQITLVLGDGRRVRWGSSERSEDKARVLAVLLRQPGRVFDVSVPEQPTTAAR